MDSHIRNGKLRLLPRLKSPYRKLNKKIALILTVVSLFFVTAGNASATDTSLSSASILDAAKPTSTATSSAKPDLTTLASPTTSQTTDPPATPLANPAPADLQKSSTPVITIEIQSAEYIPPAPPPVRLVSTKFSYPAATPVGGVVGNHFSFGYCTWYVAGRRVIPWFGNAGSWYSTASAYGFRTGPTPAPGAIMVSFEGSAAGHVAYVESARPDGTFTVSEMNFNGNFGLVTYRTITPGSTYILGFIY